jgi:hypothetical protein
MSQIGRQLVKFFQGELLKKTGEAARFQKGNVVPFTRVTEIQPNVRPAAAPAREVMRTSPGQLELPLGGVRTVRPTTMPARNVPMGRPAPEPAFRTSVNPAPRPEFTTTRQPLSPEEAALLESDPGTFRSIQDLANRASQNLGVEIKPGFFLQPNWSDKLRALETQSLVRSGRSDIVPPGVTAGLAGRPGALVPSPGGRAVDASILEAAIRDVTPGARNLGGSREAMEAVSAGARGTSEMPVDVAFRNATGGVQQLDLGSLLRGVGLGAASAGAMAGSAALVNAFRPEQAQTPMGQPTATPETGPLTPSVTGYDTVFEAPPVSVPVTGQQLPSPGFMGTPAARTRQSELIQAIQQAKATSKMPFMPGTPTAENYPDIAAYYAQRERYTNQPDVARALVGELAQQDPRYSEADIRTWAGSNPELTYELLERMKGNRAMPSQQMPQARGVEISTPMGTNFTNNALGSASAAVGAAFGSQGASDIGATVMPQLVPSLQPLPPDYQKALSRARIPMGY